VVRLLDGCCFPALSVLRQREQFTAYWLALADQAGKAMGAAAALEIVAPGAGPDSQLDLLRSIWPDDAAATDSARVCADVAEGMAALQAWPEGGFEPEASAG